MKDLLRDGDLPNVVEERRKLELLSAMPIYPQLVRYRGDQIDDRAGMISGVAVVELDHVCEELGRQIAGLKRRAGRPQQRLVHFFSATRRRA